LQGISHFWRVKYETLSYLNWMVDLQVWTRSQLVFPSKTYLLKIIWSCSDKNHWKFHISHIVSLKISQNNGSLLQASYIVLEPYLCVFWLVAWDKLNTFLHRMDGTNYAWSLKCWSSTKKIGITHKVSVTWFSHYVG
jgi:hypothetical protein